jgi:phosphomannomutase
VLDDLARAHGVHLTGQWSARVAGTDGMARLAGAMAQLRTHPPTELAGRAVVSVTDLIDGDAARGFPPSDVLTIFLDGARVVVRPSGTEPKLKCYVEVVEQVEADDLAGARRRAREALEAITSAIAAATGLT